MFDGRVRVGRRTLQGSSDEQEAGRRRVDQFHDEMRAGHDHGLRHAGQRAQNFRSRKDKLHEEMRGHRRNRQRHHLRRRDPGRQRRRRRRRRGGSDRGQRLRVRPFRHADLRRHRRCRPAVGRRRPGQLLADRTDRHQRDQVHLERRQLRQRHWRELCREPVRPSDAALRLRGRGLRRLGVDQPRPH